ncbi:MAG: glycosyltransferase family 39 protein [Deltaproteobacteria bacterium]|nr:glycosyltransferase family 39 protein [Deltaproteobacteria bacterium]
MTDRRARFEALGLAGATFALALVIRGLYLLSVRHAVFFEHLQTEPARYDAWAHAILRGRAAFRPPLDEAPGFPYFVATIFRVVGHSVLAVTVVQALLDAIACALLALVARRLGGLRAGIATGALAALYATTTYFCGQLEPATLALFAIALALWATPIEGASRVRWMLAGLAWAAAILIRSELVLALPFVLAHAVLVGGRRALATATVAPAVLLAISLGVNWASCGRPVLLTTGAGENLWIGNNPLADGVSPFLHGDQLAVTRAVERTAHDAVEADTLFRAQARFGDFLRLAPRKLAWTLNAKELPNAADIDWERSQSWLLRLPLPGFGLLLPFALVGALTLRRDRRALILLGPIAVALAVCVAFFTNARFRLELVPALLVLAGVGIAGAFEGRERIAKVAVLALGLLLAWNDFDGVRGYRIPELDMDTAALQVVGGDVEGAIARLRAAIGARPEDPSGWAQLAGTLANAGRVPEAQQVWSDALQRRSSDPYLQAAAAQFARRYATLRPQ